MAAQVLIPPTMAEVTRPRRIGLHSDAIPATLTATGLSGTETIPILYSSDDGGTFQPAIQGGEAVVLSVDNNILPVNAPLFIAVTKPATVNEVGVFISHQSEV